jgi:hypothetical protein
MDWPCRHICDVFKIKEQELFLLTERSADTRELLAFEFTRCQRAVPNFGMSAMHVHRGLQALHLLTAAGSLNLTSNETGFRQNVMHLTASQSFKLRA